MKAEQKLGFHIELASPKPERAKAGRRRLRAMAARARCRSFFEN